MSTVACYGEALIDFLNTGQLREGGLGLKQFTQYPGGAPANAAVAIARLGGDARFIGQVGNDHFGGFLLDALAHYGVDVSFALQHPVAPTALAYVFLDERGERSFEFRRDNTADLLLRLQDLEGGWLRNVSIFHCCSNTLTTTSAAAVTLEALAKAREAGALISVDANLRHNLWPGGAADRPQVQALLESADLVKFSREELDYLAGDRARDFLQSLLAGGAGLILVTDGGGEARYLTAGFDGSLLPPAAKVVDTTAAGDSFIGAVLSELAARAEPFALLAEEQQVIDVVGFALRCGAHAVARPGAFTAMPTRANLAAG